MTESILIDTNIFIRMYRGETAYQEIIDGFDRAFINTIVYFELVSGEPNRQRYARMEQYLAPYELIHLDPATCARSWIYCDGISFQKD